MMPGQRFRDVLSVDQYAALSARLETADFFTFKAFRIFN
jgi:hypothetical protein